VNIALIDYDAGNIHSAHKALERAARDAGLSATVTVTADPKVVAKADRIVLPGDGAFADCMRHLEAVPGMIETLEDTVRRKGRPFFGICVGMQLLAERGLEHGVTQGLGWIPGEVRLLAPADPALKVPHMGWNTLQPLREHALLDGLRLGEDGLHAYFLHAYHLVVGEARDLVARADYGGTVTAIVARDNMAGTQFHPEKSQRLGLGLLANFLRWKP
jgi:glutamine amidotransferase